MAKTSSLQTILRAVGALVVLDRLWFFNKIWRLCREKSPTVAFANSEVLAPVCRKHRSKSARLPNGEPTEEAKDAGVAVLVVPPDGSHVFWVWDKEKTLTLLERAGHQRLTPPHADGPAPTKLLGPFTARPNGGDGFEIVDANGIVGIWCRGEWLSGVLVKLLNVCHRNNLFFG